MFSGSVSTKSEAPTPLGQILVELNCHKQVWPLLGCLEGPVSAEHFCALTFGLILILHSGTSRRTALRLYFVCLRSAYLQQFSPVGNVQALLQALLRAKPGR